MLPARNILWCNGKMSWLKYVIGQGSRYFSSSLLHKFPKDLNDLQIHTFLEHFHK